MTKGAISSAFFIPLLACSHPDPHPAEWRLDSGLRIANTDASPTVVLAMDPAEVFTCSAMLMDWLEWRRAHPERFRLVFTRPPTQAEVRRLRAVRLPLAGTLAAGPGRGTPMELVFHGGRVIYADSGVTSTSGSALLTRLRKHSLEDVVLEPSALPSP